MIIQFTQGCLWGGRIPEVFDLMKELDRRTTIDEKNNVIAVWHDESHLNCFYSENIEKVHKKN